MVSASQQVFLVAILYLWVQNAQSHQLPKDFVKCRPSDESCILKRTNEIVKNHSNGYPELLLEQIDPIRIGDIKLNQGNQKSPVNINLEITDAYLHGNKNATFTKFTGFTKDPNSMKIDFECMIPRVIIKSKYKVKGQLLVLPINGEGVMELTITGLKMKGQMKPGVEVRNGKTYVLPANRKLKIKPDLLRIHMTNLFNGDKVLSENILNVINENWELLWDELEPLFNEQILKADDARFGVIFGNIPYDELFIID